uniref:C-type lectin domain family 2 member D n=1 Tax=Anas platyrhynchos TaxID=8839 RepID=A0A8B9QX39_ANAPL
MVVTLPVEEEHNNEDNDSVMESLLTKCKARRVAAWKLYVFGAISLIVFVVLISIIGVRSQVVSGLIPAAPAAGLSQRPCSCPPSWIGFEGKCFYFSDGEKNQTLSQADCHARGANLAVIQSKKELVRLGLFSFFVLGGGQSSGGDGEPLSTLLPFCSQDFMMRYKGSHDHWIGLSRQNPRQRWEWDDGTEFDSSL